MHLGLFEFFCFSLVLIAPIFGHRFCKDVENHENLHLLPKLLFCGQTSGSNYRNVSTEEVKVMGGFNAGKGEFPWMASIHENGVHNCGGSVINNRYILTAAHCLAVFQRPEEIIVELRMYKYELDCFYDNRMCNPPPLKFGAEDFIFHEHYSALDTRNDIGLIRLSEEILPQDPFIKPICLPTQCNLIEASLDGTLMTVAGWGFTEDEPTKKHPSVLQKANLIVVSKRECIKELSGSPVTTNAGQICVKGGFQRRACHGDSGGPLMLELSSGEHQMGIVSFGPDCNVLEMDFRSDVYTKVSEYMLWILDNIKE